MRPVSAAYRTVPSRLQYACTSHSVLGIMLPIEGQNPLEEGLAATLESIRGQIEEGSGKVEPPATPGGVGPDTEENPAVVRDDPPPYAS